MMGILPLQFLEGESADSLGLTGEELITVDLDDNVRPRDKVRVRARDKDGKVTEFEAIARFDSEVEIDYYRHGGILQMVLRQKLGE
ncbi:MAG: aconitate hydratase, partial [Clostridiales bacterium]|nr:aconitate hydratase [Clostridiales bacterium]